MLEGKANVESRADMEFPYFVGAKFVVENDMEGNGSKGGKSVVEWSIELFQVWLVWVQCGFSEEVEGKFGLGEEIMIIHLEFAREI